MPRRSAAILAFLLAQHNSVSLARARSDSPRTLFLPDVAGSPAHSRLVVAAGKEGRIYLPDRPSLGQYCNSCPLDTQIPQSLPTALAANYSSPAYFYGMVYFAAAGDTLKGFSISSAALSPLPVTQSGQTFGFPGATPSVSSNGLANGIVWLLDVSGYAGPAPAVLDAFDAANLATRLYGADQAAAQRDQAGLVVKFTVPTVANGKVFVPAAGELDVYGILP